MIQTVAVNIAEKVAVAQNPQFDLGTVQMLSQLSVHFEQQLVLNIHTFIIENL